MHAYEKVVGDAAKKKAIVDAISYIIEIQWNVKADPITKFFICVDEGYEKFTDKIKFIENNTDEIFAEWKGYAKDPEMKAALNAAWNHVYKEHLIAIPNYKEYTKFYHRDHEDPQDPPTITLEQIAEWVDDYKNSRR